MENCPIIYHQGVQEVQFEGTSLGDIRLSYPSAYLLTRNSPHIAIRSSGFVLQNGTSYDLVIPKLGDPSTYFTPTRPTDSAGSAVLSEPMSAVHLSPSSSSPNPTQKKSLSRSSPLVATHTNTGLKKPCRSPSPSPHLSSSMDSGCSVPQSHIPVPSAHTPRKPLHSGSGSSVKIEYSPSPESGASRPRSARATRPKTPQQKRVPARAVSPSPSSRPKTSPARPSTPGSNGASPNSGSKMNPNLRACYVCGRMFTVHSLDIHLPQCIQKREYEQNLLPKDQRTALTHVSNANQLSVDDALNAYEVNMVECEFCGRTFSDAKRLAIHNRSCTADSPARSSTRGS
eukprot:GCRY01004598.1.p1 GENE.GCRY01004598.1~~GCRY01004598.1.p1  ORF type:complete len:343 (-),score=39.53 GCRY01004598.1:669-1697(-)